MDNTVNKKVTAIILAAGNSLRFGDGSEKVKIEILGDTVLAHAVAAFENAETVNSIIIVAKDTDIGFVKEHTRRFRKVVGVVAGGESRAQSARVGVLSTGSDTEYVAIHDAARCLVTPCMIDDANRAAFVHGAASLVTKIYDTVKKIDSDGKISQTLSRDELLLAATPQVFSRELYLRALEENEDLMGVTDDNSLLEKIGVKVFPVITDAPNLKITTKADIGYCEYILSERGKV